MRILRNVSAFAICAFAATGMALPVLAATQTQDGTVDVSGLVAGPPPTMAPTIDEPAQNTTFTQKNIAVVGGCSTGLIVRIFRNAIFAGSALCQNTNTYALQIDLTEGRNDLVARQYDSSNQSSPDSGTTTVFFVPPVEQPHLPGEVPGGSPPPSLPPSGGSSTTSSAPPAQTTQFQLIIDYDYSFRGVAVNYPLHLPVHFLGGTPPYAVSVAWGDGNQSVISRENAEQFFVDHTYSKAGAYTVKLRISDKNGNQAFLQFVLIVNGNGSPNDTILFGLPTTFEAWIKMIIPMFGFGVISFIGGFFFSHYWQRKRSPSKKSHAAQKKT